MRTEAESPSIEIPWQRQYLTLELSVQRHALKAVKSKSNFELFYCMEYATPRFSSFLLIQDTGDGQASPHHRQCIILRWRRRYFGLDAEVISVIESWPGRFEEGKHKMLVSIFIPRQSPSRRQELMTHIHSDVQLLPDSIASCLATS